MTVPEGRVGTPEFWGSDIRWTPRSVPGPYEPVGAVVFFCPERVGGAVRARRWRAVRAPRPAVPAPGHVRRSPAPRAPSKPPELCC